MGRIVTVVPSRGLMIQAISGFGFSCCLDHFVVRDAIQSSTAKGKEND